MDEFDCFCFERGDLSLVNIVVDLLSANLLLFGEVDADFFPVILETVSVSWFLVLLLDLADLLDCFESDFFDSLDGLD